MAARGILFPAVVVRPPIPPGRRVFAKRSSGDGFECGGNQVLCRGVERIVIKQVEQLGDGGQPLFPGEQARSRESICRALADLRRRVMSQDVQKNVNRFPVPQHRQSFHGPEAHFLISILRIKFEGPKRFGRLNSAITESAESPERHETLIRAALNLALQFLELSGAFMRLLAARSISTAAMRTRGSLELRASSTRWKSRSESCRCPRQEVKFL